MRQVNSARHAHDDVYTVKRIKRSAAAQRRPRRARRRGASASERAATLSARTHRQRPHRFRCSAQLLETALCSTFCVPADATPTCELSRVLRTALRALSGHCAADVGWVPPHSRRGPSPRRAGARTSPPRHNLAQPQRNTEFICGGENALKPYDGKDGCPPAVGMRSMYGAPPPRSPPTCPGLYLLSPGAAGPTWAATTAPQSSRPISLCWASLAARMCHRSQRHARARSMRYLLLFLPAREWEIDQTRRVRLEGCARVPRQAFRGSPVFRAHASTQAAGA
jgi:hypothetical protein